MATTSSVIAQHIDGLSTAIGGTIKAGQNELLTSEEDVLKVFKLHQKNVVFTWSNESLQVVIEEANEKSVIPLEDIEGLPKECFASRKKMIAFLSACNLSIPKYLDQDICKIRLGLSGIKGGGNIGAGINYWPLEVVGGYSKFVIPYKLFVNADVASILNQESSAYALRHEIAQRTEKGKKLEEELSTYEIIRQAIGIWNATGLVRLVNITNENVSRWVTFSNNNLGICRAPCIGMCTPTGEQQITCDLEGEFHNNRLQSMLHEIGHVIGLRHEHARKDRDEYIKTSLDEQQDGSEVGGYDFLSVMHYGIGNYKGGNFLVFSEKFKGFMLQNFPAEASKLLADKEATVGKTPSISAGDEQSVVALIQLAAAKEAADKAAKEAADKAAKEAMDRKRASESAQSANGAPVQFYRFRNLSISNAQNLYAAPTPSYYDTSSDQYGLKKGVGGMGAKKK